MYQIYVLFICIVLFMYHLEKISLRPYLATTVYIVQGYVE